jgi:hypothetical protein
MTLARQSANLMQSQLNTIEHYVSRAILKRFRRGSERLQCYQVQTGQWNQKSVHDVCSARGYNQIIVGSQSDHTIDNDLKKIENELPTTLKFLDSLPPNQRSSIPQEILVNLRDYFSFLKLISPVAKPGAIVALTIEINMGLEKEDYNLLRELHVTEEAIQKLREYYLQGGRVVIEAKNLMQQLFRFQFPRLLPSTQNIFQQAKWFLASSPIDVPLSDVGIVPMHLTDLKANHFILPISPRLVLEAIFYFDQGKNRSSGIVERMEYTVEEAEYRLECICASALSQIICSQRINGISDYIKRAFQNNIRFHKIVSPELAFQSGLEEADPNFALKVMSTQEYIQYVHGHIQPPMPLV